MEATDDEMKQFVSRASSMIKKYDYKSMLFSFWKDYFLNLVRTLNVPDNRKSEFLYLMLSQPTRYLIENCYHPTNPKDISFETLMIKLTHYIPEDIKAYRSNFKERRQDENETIEHYAIIMQELFKRCKYRPTQDFILYKTFLEGLRDRSIANYVKKRKLLTFKMMVASCITIEKLKVENEF